MARLSASPQREHALGVSDERGDRRAHRRARARRSPTSSTRHAGRDRVRPEHDDAHLPSRARARPRLGQGDEIVVTELDHHGNVAPWRALETEQRRRRSARCGCDPTDRPLDFGRPRAATRPAHQAARASAPRPTRSARSPTRARHAMARDAWRARVRRRGALRAAHASSTCRRIGCDFLACSAYKFYGPHVGILYGKHELIESLDVPRLDPAPQESPERLETGTQNHEGIVGAAAAVDFLASLGARRRDAGASGCRAPSRAFTRAARRCSRDCGSGSAAIDGVTLYGPEPGTPRTPTRRFTLARHSTDDVARAPRASAASSSQRRLLRSHGRRATRAAATTASCAPARPATPPRRSRTVSWRACRELAHVAGIGAILMAMRLTTVVPLLAAAPALLAQAPKITAAGDPSVRADTIYRLAVEAAKYPEQDMRLPARRRRRAPRGRRPRHAAPSGRSSRSSSPSAADAATGAELLRGRRSTRSSRVNWMRVVKPDGTVISDTPSQVQESDVPAQMRRSRLHRSQACGACR